MLFRSLQRLFLRWRYGYYDHGADTDVYFDGDDDCDLSAGEKGAEGYGVYGWCRGGCDEPWRVSGVDEAAKLPSVDHEVVAGVVLSLARQ